jgi:hypothetical protein
MVSRLGRRVKFLVDCARSWRESASRAVAQAQPGIKVKKLPPYWRDMLPPEPDAGMPSAPAMTSTRRRAGSRPGRKKERITAKP